MWAIFLIVHTVAMTIALCALELETCKVRTMEEITVVRDIMIVSVYSFTIRRLH